MQSAKIMLLVTLGIGFFCPSARGQTLTVRLLNAKSGKPMRKQNVTFAWDKNAQPSSLIRISDVAGRGVVPINVCGKQSVVPHPGEIVFWALPRPFLDFQ